MHLCYFIFDVNVWLDPEAMKHMMDYVSMQVSLYIYSITVGHR